MNVEFRGRTRQNWYIITLFVQTVFPNCFKFSINNCRSNPYCLERLGLEEFDKLRSDRVVFEEKKIEKRDLENEPCGLFNLAATCYLNSFLQVSLTLYYELKFLDLF